MIDWLYLGVVAVPCLLLCAYASWSMKKRIKRYSGLPTTRAYTGRMATEQMLETAGISDVEVIETDGKLNGFYDPLRKKLTLSSQVHDRTSVTAISVASRKSGHAVQHASGYYPLKWVAKYLPPPTVGSRVGLWSVVVSLVIGLVGYATQSIGIGWWIDIVGATVFGLLMIFQLVTLPIEFQSSKRGRQLVVEADVVGPQEALEIAKVLNAALWTYVAAFVTSLVTFLILLYRAGLIG